MTLHPRSPRSPDHAEGICRVEGWRSSCRCGWRGDVRETPLLAEGEAARHTCFPASVTAEEAAAIVSAAFDDDHDSDALEAAVKRLGDAVDALAGKAKGP